MSKHPGAWYYQESIAVVTYSDKPTGVLDVPRLIKNQPCWRSPEMPYVQKPKKLVLSDWTYKYRTGNDKDKITDKLLALQKEGFEIFYLENQKLVPFRQSSGDSLYNLSHLPEEHVLQAASLEASIPFEQIFVLDEREISRLLDEQVLDEGRSVNVEHLKNLSPDEQTALIQYFHRVSPPLKTIVHRIFPHESFPFLDKLQQEFPNLQHQAQYEKIVLKNNQAEMLVSQGFIVHRGTRISLDDLSNLMTLDLDECTLSWQTLGALINKTKRLDCLTLGRVTGQIVPDEFPKTSLDTVKIFGDFISDEALKHFIQKMESLRVFSFFFQNDAR